MSAKYAHEESKESILFDKRNRSWSDVPMINLFEDEFEFLSNFYLHEIMYEDQVFPCTESAYQAAKTLNKEARVRFTTTPGINPVTKKEYAVLTAGLAKKHGRKLVMREDWEQVKLSIMEMVLRAKFSNPELRAKLIATGNHELIEGNWWNDTEWGVCRGVGKNKLGKLLMKLRDEYAKE